MKCFSCKKGTLERSLVDMAGERNGESFTVRTEGLACPKCGFTTISNAQSGEFTRLVSDAYRAKYHLLTSDQIRSARMRLRKSQREFAEYLGVGIASVKRWEAGQIQDAAMDRLMRLKTDPAEALNNYLEISGAYPSTEELWSRWCVAVRGPEAPSLFWHAEKTHSPFVLADDWKTQKVSTSVC